MKIPVTKPFTGPEEVAAAAERILGGWLVQGPKVAEFEQAWCKFTGAQFSRATTSCTTALHLALLALGVGPGDEVIVPAFTWIATANSVEYCGARPVFADIELDTFNIDPQDVARKISPRTKVIMPVHQFGLAADLESILAIAKAHNLKVVEDGACACGSLYDGKHVGTFGEIGCFSFHPRKAITTGEGGMLTTANPEFARVFEVLRSHGAEMNDLARHTAAQGFILPDFKRLGYNYRMTDIQAAIGIEQLKRVEQILSLRRAIAARFNTELSGIAGLKLPSTPEKCRHAYQSYVTYVEKDNAERNRVALALEQLGIATRQGTHAVHNLAYYKNKYQLKISDCPNAWRADQQSMTLPVYAGMTEAEQEYVISNTRKVLGAA